MPLLLNWSFHSLLWLLIMLIFHTAEYEQEEDIFSPQFGVNTCSSTAKQDVYLPDNSACDESRANTKQLDPISQVQDSCLIIHEKAPGGNNEVTETFAGDKKNYPKDQQGGNFKQVTAEDVLCVRCKQLLFRPMVLNCGHGSYSTKIGH